MRIWSRPGINPDPLEMLSFFASGAMICFTAEEDDESSVGWVKHSHRGIQPLDAIRFPKGQRRYIFSPKFQVRYDTAFSDVLAACADRKPTWLTPAVCEGYTALHQAGFAHSYEAWHDGQLAAGGIGIQVGGLISCDTMFHRVSHASKAVWGRTLLHLRDRGFSFVDTNCVADHDVEYGEIWVPQWQFEQMAQDQMRRELTLADGIPSPRLPLSVRARLPLHRAAQAIARRLRWRAASI